MLTRRGFLRTTGTAGIAATRSPFTDAGLARMQAAGERLAAQPAASVAADEDSGARSSKPSPSIAR